MTKVKNEHSPYSSDFNNKILPLNRPPFEGEISWVEQIIKSNEESLKEVKALHSKPNDFNLSDENITSSETFDALTSKVEKQNCLVAEIKSDLLACIKGDASVKEVKVLENSLTFEKEKLRRFKRLLCAKEHAETLNVETKSSVSKLKEENLTLQMNLATLQLQETLTFARTYLQVLQSNNFTVTGVYTPSKVKV